MSRFVLTAQLQLQAPNNVRQVVQQIQSQLNGVNVNVQVQNAPQAQRQLQRVTQATNQATTAAERMGKAFALSVRRFAAFSVATRAVSLFTNTLGDAVQTAIDFERQLIKVSQVTGKSIGQLRGLTKQITQLSTGFGVASSDLLGVSTILAQAGLSAEDTSIALRTLAKAALAPNFDSISETAEGAIAILAQFGQGVEALESQLGSINAVAGAFAVEASDLIDVIRRTGGVFKSSGGSLNELLALFTSVRATTRESAESIGTGLRTIFTRIQRPKTIEFLKQFGVELVDLNGKFVGPYEAIKRLSEALAGLGEGDLTFIRIAEELGGFRQIGKVLPLLQQFSTAQSALNVAMQAGDTLTKDAASAQAALAIRIMKVREEFLALIRSVTETSTFQVMANTALTLASALIKIGDAIKPLLPMLAALAAFRLAKGMGSFFGGIMSGAASGRTYNKGGKVLGFARGGLVPGSGNRDTVPAMLAPGEFVIRKSSVNRLGASNLAAMNENKYAAGGFVNRNRAAYGAAVPAAIYKRAKGQFSESAWRKMSQDERDKAAASFANKMSQRQKTSKKDADKLAKDRKKILDKYPGGAFTTRPKSIGGFFLTPEMGTDGKYSLPTDRVFDLNGQKAAILQGSTIENYVPFRGDLAKNLAINNIVDSNAQKGIADAVTNASNQIGNLLNTPQIAINKNRIQKAAAKSSSDKQVYSTLGGYMYEGIIQGLTGSKLGGGQIDFDFNSLTGSNKKSLAAFFGRSESEFSGLIKADAKRALNSKMNSSIFDKIANSITKGDMRGVKKLGELRQTKKYFGGMIHKFATGGNVGTDTIPALLTPGEFVVNRSSAQRIGYGNLNRMNKVGKYAKGGVVQKFATGTAGAGAQPIMSSISAPGIDTRAPTMLNKIIAKFTGTLSVADIDLSTTSKMFNHMRQVLPTMTRAIQEYANANNLTSSQMGQLTAVYYETFRKMKESGASLDQIREASKQYVQALKGGASGVAKSTSVTTSRSQTSSQAQARSISTTTNNNSSPRLKTAMSVGPSGGGMFNNVGANIAMVSAALSSMLPPLDENSGMLTKMSSSLLSLTTTVGGVIYALSQFGIQLQSKQIMDFFSGKGLPTKGISEAFNKITGQSGVGRVFRAATQGTMRGGLSAGQSAAQTAMSRTGISGLTGRAATLAGQGAGKIGPVINNLSKLAGPALGVGIAFQAITGMIDSYTDYQGKLNKAVQDGNIAEAEKQATNKASSDAADTLGTNIIAASAMFGPWGLAVGAATAGIIKLAQVAGYGDSLVDFMSIFGGPTLDSVKSLAAAQAGAVKTQKALDEAQKTATTAMEDFKNGTISASEALARVRAKTAEANAQMGRANTFATDNLQNRSEFGRGAALRNIGALGGLNPFMETSWARNARLGKESADQINSAARQQQQAFDIESPARQAAIRSGIARGRNMNAVRAEALGPLQQQISQQRLLGNQLQSAGDEAGAKAAFAAATQMELQLKQVNKEIENIEKEVKRQKDLYDAMNLGLRAATATSSALSASMDRFSAGFEVGGSTLGSDIEFLQQSMSSAAQAMDPNEIKDAVSNVSSNLREFGVGDEYIKKFEGNVAAFTQAQQGYNKAFENIKSSMKDADFKNLNADELKKKFADELTKGMGPDVSDEAKENLRKVINGMELGESEVDKIIDGDLSVFGNKLTEVQKKMFEDLQKIEQDRARAEQVLIDFTKKRIDAERNLVAAQQEALDLTLEGREVQAKYGGKAVSAEERRANILGKSNVEGNRLGLTAMRTGSIQELRARNAEIRGGFANIEARRTQRGGMDRTAGVEADEQQKDLQKAYKTQVDTIRNLIKLEEEQLKITQEKNKLEKDSLESLVKGDVEEFFKKQSAVGATAAVASGSSRLQNFYGAEALGMAYQDIQRQQEAGVQEIYGQSLSGPGGLSERAAGAALSARGVTDMRSAQVLAGTTAEEEASKARLRELGGMLGETGQLGQEMAEMQVATANINVDNAQVKFNEVMERGRQKAEEGLSAEAMARGGIVYANRGIFVPRGTDTVPAMLTPGEFVVNRAAVQRGNNLQILRAMNSGTGIAATATNSVTAMARGGMVRYLAKGSQNPESDSGMGMGNIVQALNRFNTDLANNINKLSQINISIKLDSTNVNINLNDNGLLRALTGQVKTEIFKIIESEFKVDQGGKLRRNSTVLG